MATIQKRGQSYSIRVSCGYRTDGSQIIQSMTFKPDEKLTPKQVEKELQRQTVLFEEKCAAGQTSSAVKFEDFAKQWFEEYAYIKLKQTTILSYQRMEERIYKAIGHVRLDKLTPRIIQKFIHELCEEKRLDGKDKNGGKLSPKYIKLHKSMISTICDYAVKMQMITSNPCKNVVLPKPAPPEKVFYSIEETQKLLDLFQEEDDCNCKYVTFYTTAIYTGFRLGELMGLEWRDVDFENHIISIKRTCQYAKEKGGLYTDTPKTASSLRSLKVPPEVIAVMLKWRELQDVQRKKTGSKWIETDRIFTKWNGLTLDRSAPGYFFKQFCKRNNMRYVNNHSWRHFNASALILNGVDLQTVSSCLGHSETSTTMNVYLHTFQTAQARAMEAVASVINFKPQTEQPKITAAV